MNNKLRGQAILAIFFQKLHPGKIFFQNVHLPVPHNLCYLILLSSNRQRREETERDEKHKYLTSILIIGIRYPTNI